MYITHKERSRCKARVWSHVHASCSRGGGFRICNWVIISDSGFACSNAISNPIRRFLFDLRIRRFASPPFRLRSLPPRRCFQLGQDLDSLPVRKVMDCGPCARPRKTIRLNVPPPPPKKKGVAKTGDGGCHVTLLVHLDREANN